MWTIQHVLGGAATGAVLRRPWLAWPVAYLTHLALDFTPHVDYHALFVSRYQGPPQAWAALAGLDLVSTLVWPMAIVVMWRHPLRWVVLGAPCLAT